MASDMTSDSIEVRYISRGVALLLALIGVTLLSSVRLPAMPAPGVSDAVSIQVVRKKDNEAALFAAQEAAALAASTPLRMAGADGMSGLGDEIRLWINGPGGEIVFRNQDRFRRCVTARARRLEDSECPSAADMRQMVLEKAGGVREAARAQRGA